MVGGFKINKQGIRQMSREIEREFAKHPVRVPLEADQRDVSLPRATTVINYHGPVVTVNGDHSQIAWDNKSVQHSQARRAQIAPGYEKLAQLLADVLASMPSFGLDETDEADLRTSAEAVLEEVVKPEPDQTVVRRGVTFVKGLLAPIGAGLSTAATAETAEAVREAIDALGSALPF